MTTPRDTEPLAPRRPLGKAQPPADGGSTPPSSANGLKPPPIESTPSEPFAADSHSDESSNGRSDSYHPPASPAEPGRDDAADGSKVVEADEDDSSRDDAVSEGADSSSEAARSEAMSSPTTYPEYTPTTDRDGHADLETQAAMPPVGTLPVPPAPEPTAPTQVDKRAERAAQKAQRRLAQSKPRTIRRAKLRVVRVDPWSVTKAAFLLSIAFGVMCVVAVFLIFSIMDASGLWDSVNTTIQGVVDQRPDEAFDINEYVGMSRVMGITMLISAIDVVIITALATLGAFIYNMAASLLGGVEVTLAEDLN